MREGGRQAPRVQGAGPATGELWGLRFPVSP